MASFAAVLFAISLYATSVVGALSHSAVCKSIAGQLSNASEVYYAPSPKYELDLYHWMTSSSQNAACVVEVGSNEDVSVVMKAIASSKTPFAIKSGGHSSNQGFSSTPGVQISMTRFNAVTLNAGKTSITVGMGNVWTDVYSALQGTGYNINGGRVAGPGTGGFSLGGGYNWKTNQYGLTVDTIQSLTLVLPNGTITHVDKTTPDLLFALKGGLNRFGVVTEIVYKALPQKKVWGGIKVYGPKEVETVVQATNSFQRENTDPKSQIITTLNGGATGTEAIVLFFHDGYFEPPAFGPFVGIRALVSDVKTQTYEKFSKTTPSELQAGHRGAFHSMMTSDLTQGFLDAVLNETNYYGRLATSHGATFISYDVEPFMTDYGKLATDSAFPHSGSPLPLNLYFSWTDASEDTFWRNTMVTSVEHLTEVAKAEGIFNPDFPVYPNYALASYTGDQIYGPTNAARLRTIRDQVDPDRIMELSGGFVL